MSKGPPHCSCSVMEQEQQELSLARYWGTAGMWTFMATNSCIQFLGVFCAVNYYAPWNFFGFLMVLTFPFYLTAENDKWERKTISIKARNVPARENSASWPISASLGRLWCQRLERKREEAPSSFCSSSDPSLLCGPQTQPWVTLCREGWREGAEMEAVPSYLFARASFEKG